MAEQEDHAVEAFLKRWRGVTGSERANYQLFLTDLCRLLTLPQPEPASEETRDNAYVFERRVSFAHGDGHSSNGFIDLYRRGAFVLEAKKVRAGAHTRGFDDALMRARAQGEGYARALPAAEGRPPFVIVVDVGHVIELYAEFTRSGATYTPFPDPRSYRIKLDDLRQQPVRDRLKALWLDPLGLDPARVTAKVTRNVAVQLANVARSLEVAGHSAHDVAAFLTRCLFSMFAEDVGLLPIAASGDGAFVDLLKRYGDEPATLRRMIAALWSDMDRGGFSAALAKDVLRFNGKLFKKPSAEGYVLPLSREQIEGLLNAARASWKDVEPAIFGTLLERALDPQERHALGAHYTPRAYVERLVLPTVIEPLRSDWADVQAAAVVLAKEGKVEAARAEVRKFHHELCGLQVLDPACGSGNFLYVTLEHLKRIEGEVLNQLEAFGETQARLGLEGETVTLRQLRGIELNERAAALAELVLWIGYLQWHIRTRGNKGVAEPVIHDYGNIEQRDAVLECDRQELAYGHDGKLLTRWDGRTYKIHPVTGAPVPDQAAQVPQWKYIHPRKASWPRADFIVGNPPYIGKRNMRSSLGDGYVEALRATWADVPDSADFVMYWWHKAAHAVCSGSVRRMGFVTTNSLRQEFNRRIVQDALDNGLSLSFVIPDHPWVDSANGAAVRIALSVSCKAPKGTPGRLLTVVTESPGEQGEVDVTLTVTEGVIHADLRIGADLDDVVALRANMELSNIGVYPLGRGFILSAEKARALKERLSLDVRDRLLRMYRNGRDLTARPRNVFAIDTFGFEEEHLRSVAPEVWQWLHDHVKPERDEDSRPTRRNRWWRYGEDHPRVRRAIAGLPRFIVTVMTAKHRVFQFLDGDILPDQKLVVIGLDDPFFLGVVSSSLHGKWALAAGGWLGFGNDPVYAKSRSFEAFPFPDADTGLTPALRTRISTLAEQIDSHRKRQQAAQPGLTLTGMYNVLEALRDGRELTTKEKKIHEQGLVGVLKDLHDNLDVAVLAAYSLGDTPETEWLQHVADLNARRADEERHGTIRWLRPEFQNPASARGHDLADAEMGGVQAEMSLDGAGEPPPATNIVSIQPWPTSLPEQVRAVAQMLGGQPDALTLPEIEARFRGRGLWKRGLPRILDTLEALGRARQPQVGRWTA